MEKGREKKIRIHLRNREVITYLSKIAKTVEETIKSNW